MSLVFQMLPGIEGQASRVEYKQAGMGERWRQGCCGLCAWAEVGMEVQDCVEQSNLSLDSPEFIHRELVTQRQRIDETVHSSHCVVKVVHIKSM